MRLNKIYQPIRNELASVEQILKDRLQSSKHKSILEINNFLLDAQGKRLRPALVLLSAKASQNKPLINHRAMVSLAAAVELIHIASLIHDDVIDRANLRHDKPTINSRFGQDVSIALGDYLHSVGFELISQCGNAEILQCISSATKAMCEGELVQVCERDNLHLLKQRYMVIVKKKTASLFAASCRSGTLIFNSCEYLQNAMEEYGLNFGIAFQIADDYLDLIGKEKELGKTPGQDIEVGEMTLPLLNLLGYATESEKKKLRAVLSLEADKRTLQIVKLRLVNSKAALRTKETVSSFIDLAKGKISLLSDSPYKDSLLNLADFVMERGFNTQS